MTQSFSFNTSVITSTASKYNAEVFDSSIEAYKNGDYLRSLHALLDATDPSIREKYGNPAGNEFRIPHGPIYITIKADQEKISITAPFVTLPEEHSIAMMREVAVINFNDLDLSRLHLKENGLYFEYSSPLSFSHPRKLYHVLNEICRIGSKYDYEFRHTFGAQRLSEPFFTSYEEKTVDYVGEVIRQSCEECLEVLSYFEPSRRFGDMRNAIKATFLRLIYVIQPQDRLLHTLQKAVRDMDRDIPLAIVIANGKQTIRELQEQKREELVESLYFTETFIPAKKRSNLQNIRENYEKCYKWAAADMSSGEYRSVCFRILCKFYETYHQNQMQENLDHLLTESLRQASALSWAEAAFILYETLKTITFGPLLTNRGNNPIAA